MSLIARGLDEIDNKINDENRTRLTANGHGKANEDDYKMSKYRTDGSKVQMSKVICLSLQNLDVLVFFFQSIFDINS
jgi:hypothetical protein